MKKLTTAIEDHGNQLVDCNFNCEGSVMLNIGTEDSNGNTTKSYL